MDLNPFIVTSAALLDSINPCAISVLLLTIGFLLSLGKGKEHIFKMGFVYIGALYLTILALLHGKTTFATGFLYLLYYNLIFVSPLIIILAAANSKKVIVKLDEWRKKHTRRVDYVSSILMIILSL